MFVDGLKSGIFCEEVLEFFFLVGSETVGVLAQSGEEAGVLGDLGSDIPEELEEVVLDDADDVEAVGNDFCIGEVSFDDSAVGGAQIDTDNAHLIPAAKGLQEAFERASALALGDIKDAVVT